MKPVERPARDRRSLRWSEAASGTHSVPERATRHLLDGVVGRTSSRTSGPRATRSCCPVTRPVTNGLIRHQITEPRRGVVTTVFAATTPRSCTTLALVGRPAVVRDPIAVPARQLRRDLPRIRGGPDSAPRVRGARRSLSVVQLRGVREDRRRRRAPTEDAGFRCVAPDHPVRRQQVARASFLTLQAWLVVSSIQFVSAPLAHPSGPVRTRFVVPAARGGASLPLRGQRADDQIARALRCAALSDGAATRVAPYPAARGARRAGEVYKSVPGHRRVDR